MSDEVANAVDEVHDALLEELRRCGVDEMTAAQSAQRACRRLQDRLGGRRHWWPAPDTTARDAGIVQDDAAGMRHADIALKYDVVVRTVERVVQRAKRPDAPAQDIGIGRDEWVL